MVEGPVEGKAGNNLDWIAGSLEIKELEDLGNPCPLKTGAPYIFWNKNKNKNSPTGLLAVQSSEPRFGIRY